MKAKDTVWQSASVSQAFLDGVRGAIPLAAEQIDIMLRVIQAAQPNPQSFLDLGCGDGVLGGALLARFPATNGVFVDFSAPMLEAARAKLAPYGSRARCIQQDYGQPAWTAQIEQYAPFDAVVSGFSIHHQPDSHKQRIYREIYHLLKPGGVFLNLEHVAPQSAWAESLFDALLVDLMYAHSQKTGSSKTYEQVAEEFHQRQDKAANILAPLQLQCEWLRDIGFIEVDCYLRVFELALFGGIKPG